jgi:hypothetical protein
MLGVSPQLAFLGGVVTFYSIATEPSKTREKMAFRCSPQPRTGTGPVVSTTVENARDISPLKGLLPARIVALIESAGQPLGVPKPEAKGDRREPPHTGQWMIVIPEASLSGKPVGRSTQVDRLQPTNSTSRIA